MKFKIATTIHWSRVIQKYTMDVSQSVIAVGNDMYRKISDISRTESPNLIAPRLVLQLSLPNPMKPGVKLRMKM